MRKKEYERLDVTVLTFSVDDAIRTSFDDSDNGEWD